MPPLVIKLLFSTMYTRSPFFIKPVVSMLTGGVNAGYIDPNLKNMFGLIDGYLAKDGGRDWLAGQKEPTAADFMVSRPCKARLLIVSVDGFALRR
jgi:glutathione S-transferase